MQTLDIPQANDLDSVRAVVRAVAEDHASLVAVADFTGFSKRHARYRLHAARVLGLVALTADASRPAAPGLDRPAEVYLPTALARRLLEAPLRSAAERGVYFDAINRSKALQAIAPDLLAASGPTVEALTDRLTELSDLSRATAERRAGTLLAWRRRVLDIQPENHDREPSGVDGEPQQLDLF
ncbi:MAG: hypothetical protein KC549_16930 [Myxococcales bacterium]|nr:hypothetical protein [Myxococcales bacterium]